MNEKFKKLIEIPIIYSNKKKFSKLVFNFYFRIRILGFFFKYISKNSFQIKFRKIPFFRILGSFSALRTLVHFRDSPK